MEQAIQSIFDSLLRIAFASWGFWLCGKAGRLYADFKDRQAAVCFGVGFLLVIMAAKSL